MEPRIGVKVMVTGMVNKSLLSEEVPRWVSFTE